MESGEDRYFMIKSKSETISKMTETQSETISLFIKLSTMCQQVKIRKKASNVNKMIFNDGILYIFSASGPADPPRPPDGPMYIQNQQILKKFRETRT